MRTQLLRLDSLSETLDAVQEVIDGGVKIPAGERMHIARWIASRQGLSGAYGNPFAGFEAELLSGIRLSTGARRANDC